MRFTAAGVGPLRRRSGHLATVDLAHDFSLDALGVQAGTLAAIDKLCSPRSGAPNHKLAAPVDNVLAQRVRDSVEVFVSDAAADEIRAGHLLAGQTTTTEVAKSLPCLRVVLRDKPHASRRLVSRLWKCDPYLHDVHSKFIWDEKSPVKLIEYSEAFGSWFQKHIRSISDEMKAVNNPHSGIKDLRLAAHRFDSSQQPLSICILFSQPCSGPYLKLFVSAQLTNQNTKQPLAFYAGWIQRRLCRQPCLQMQEKNTSD